MKINYYLRGLGIGMVVTALLMGITMPTKKMTNNQIIAEAKKLGMVESGEQTLSESIAEGDKTAKEERKNFDESIVTPGNAKETDVVTPIDGTTDIIATAAPEINLPKIGTKEDEIEDGQALKKKDSSSSSRIKSSSTNSSIKDSSSSSSEKDSSSSSVSEKESDSSSSEKEINASGMISIEITSGMSSTSVAQALKEAGVINDASAFDRFLCENGYDRKITTGKKLIPKNASNVEIAGIITVR